MPLQGRTGHNRRYRLPYARGFSEEISGGLDLKICIANTYHYRRGGDSTYTFDLAELLSARGHDVIHFAMKHRYNVDCPHSEFFVDYVDYREASEGAGPLSKLGAFIRSLYSREARAKFAALLDSTCPDIIHLQNFRRHLTFSILGPALKRGIPVVLTAHDYDPVCPNSLLFAGGAVCEVCGGRHYYRAPAKRCKEGSLAGTLALALEGYFVKAMRYYDRLDRIITPSEFARRKFIQFGYDPERVTVIHNFINTRGLEPSYGGGRYVLCFGRVSAEKGIDILIEAAARVGDVRVIVAGEGPLRAGLEMECERRGMDNVEFIGYVEKEDLMDIVRDSMFVVVPSVVHENFPYNVLESFALGKPVIASSVGGIPEMVEEGSTGYLVPPHDAAALAARMGELAGDGALRERLGRNARNRVESEFNADIHYDNLNALYREVIGRRGQV